MSVVSGYLLSGSISVSPRNKKTRFPHLPLFDWFRFFPTERVVGRKTSPREERANDANTEGPKPKVLGEKPHCFSSPRGWRARENLTKTPSKRVTGGGEYDDVGGKRSGKVEGRKRYAGTDKPENRYSKPQGHAAGHSRVRPLITKAQVLDARCDATSITPRQLENEKKEKKEK